MHPPATFLRGLALAALACAAPARADVYVSAYGGTLGGSVADPLSTSKQVTQHTALLITDSFALADLNTGTLRAAVTGEALVPYSLSSFASATARMSDSVTFHGPGSTVQVSFMLHVDGTFAMSGGNSPGNITLDGAMTIDVASATLALSRTYSPGGADTLGGSVAGSPGSFLNKTLNTADAMLVVTTTVQTEVPVSFFALITVVERTAPVGMTETADFSHTAQASLLVPAGYSYTSASGHFLATPVPEPASGALMLAGIAALGWLVRRRR
jgi:hypothetical protein